ncbi:helix-turn-helix domain-containing protein [Mycobacterium sp. AMU20-3851]|uniref:TetR/AcrR family transcriptional regulator n=1 Tax=Mycobacterium sp. AMU20-3851 TaxID=3122055 RepID=UPI0037540242
MGTSGEPGAEPATRDRLLAAAAELFGEHGYAGTSLQMIADRLGFRKGAIYHHFRARDEILQALIGPVLDTLADIVTDAEAQPSVAARAERMITGYAALAADNRATVSMLRGDPAVLEFIRSRPRWSGLINRQMTLLAAAHPGPGGRVRAAMVLSGMSAAADPAVQNPPGIDLRHELAEGARHTLGLRIPKGD